MSERIEIGDLKPGMVILRIAEQNGPVKIKKSGLVTSEDMVRGLSEMGVAVVEIDPEQTVELDVQQPAQTDSNGVTQTQALLKGQYDRQGHYDNQLADQFNRNLFLPSVQGIPSVWLVYLRQALVITFVLVLGLGIGFATATYSLWLPNEQTSQPVVAATPTEDEDKQPIANPTQQAKDIEQPALNTAQGDEVEVELALTQSQASPPREETDDSDTVLGVPLNEPQEADTSQVSPELLRRFNQAIDELDQAEPAEQDDLVVRDRGDIQRIDQLPVRLMTTLPTMTFSAHMYASRLNDRWVRVNGQRLQEGDWIDDKVRIINIEAQRVILEYQGEIFSMAALTDW